MAGQNVTVKINGVKKEYPQGTRFLELAKEYQSEYAYPIVLSGATKQPFAAIV